jgi:hypothetical protein
MFTQEQISTLETLLNDGRFFIKGNKSKIGAYASIDGKFIERTKVDNKWSWKIGKEMTRQAK